jgi:hypothetical protein
VELKSIRIVEGKVSIFRTNFVDGSSRLSDRGTVDLADGENVAVFEIDLDHLGKIRQRLPVLGRE